MGLYKPLDPLSTWENSFRSGNNNADSSMVVLPADSSLDNKFEYILRELVEISRCDLQESSKPDDDHNRVIPPSNRSPPLVQKRLAQNREAARRSRLRKKAYVRQLESSRVKLAQLEHELDMTRHQGMQHISNGLDSYFGSSKSTINSGIAVFEMEYRNWVDEQLRKICELRTALQANVGDVELRILVDGSLKHYYGLFRMKEDAAKADVFFLMSGTWRTSAEQFFLWIGGFRPSVILNQVVIPQIELLTDQQVIDVCNLRQSSQQAEDALSQGMIKLQQTLSEEVAANQLGYGSGESLVVAAMEKLEALESFVNQADHLRERIMLQMSRVLTTRQAARALLALGEYFQRLRALSSLWAARPCESM